MKIVISSNPDNLRDYLEDLENSGSSTATVEAEYGSTVVNGSLYTLAHHGERAANPCPCLHPNVKHGPSRPDVIGISHFDLDTLGGISALMGKKPMSNGMNEFWELAAKVDVSGFHKISTFGVSELAIRRLYAFSAWSKENRINAPVDGSVIDVTEKVEFAVRFFQQLVNNGGILELGDKFRSAELELNRNSLLQQFDDVGLLVRVSPQFVNHLYTSPVAGRPYEMVVAYNTLSGSITVSCADPIDGVDCCRIMQYLLGDKSGGHKGIAGSPRGLRMTVSQLERVVTYVADTLYELRWLERP